MCFSSLGFRFGLQRSLPGIAKCQLRPQTYPSSSKGSIFCCHGTRWRQWNQRTDYIQEKSYPGSDVSEEIILN